MTVAISIFNTVKKRIKKVLRLNYFPKKDNIRNQPSLHKYWTIVMNENYKI